MMKLKKIKNKKINNLINQTIIGVSWLLWLLITQLENDMKSPMNNWEYSLRTSAIDDKTKNPKIFYQKKMDDQFVIFCFFTIPLRIEI